MSEDREKFLKSWYEFGDWIPVFGSVPLRLVVSGDHSESYEMDRFHVFELENGKFATVMEYGCSCYDSADADIDLYPDLDSAMAKYNEWEKSFETRGY